ncbi:hypothetical protein U8335_02330 [Roseiconus lacunae]|uniref:hypothetical protein n=1 Tax=Roseiconus lacunae TaxID=2605694 RepID=UPI0030921F53|nr:hypothetical protein U8335_02330 [Stieleria sp. HD01]
MGKLDDLREQHRKTIAKGKRLRKQLHEIGEAECDLRRRIRNLENRERLAAAMGKAGAVILSHQCGRDELCGQPATVLKVNRTRALVEVNGREWSVSFDLLIDAENESDDLLAAQISDGLNGAIGSANGGL